MTAPGSLRPDVPRWEILIAHHLPSRWHRTIAFRGRHRTYHVCARCTGQLIGLFAWLAVFATLAFRGFSVFDDRVQWLFAVFPLPAAVDWVTQAAGHRESRNSLRLLSGMLLGAAFTDLVASLVLAQWTILLAGLVVLVLYIVAVIASLWFSGAWRKVLADHFPGITFE